MAMDKEKPLSLARNGTALIAAMLALFASAGMIGGLYAMAKASQRISTGIERSLSLQETADGMVAACARIINFVHNDQNPATVFTALPGTTLLFDPFAGASLPVTGLNGEIMGGDVDELTLKRPDGSYSWFSDRMVVNGANVVNPDFVIQTPREVIYLDIDLLHRKRGTAVGSGVEFGAGAEESSQGATKVPLYYRCYAEVWQRCTNNPMASPDNRCPHAASMGFIRTEMEITPQFVRLWGAR